MSMPLVILLIKDPMSIYVALLLLFLCQPCRQIYIYIYIYSLICIYTYIFWYILIYKYTHIYTARKVWMRLSSWIANHDVYNLRDDKYQQVHLKSLWTQLHLLNSDLTRGSSLSRYCFTPTLISLTHFRGQLALMWTVLVLLSNFLHQAPIFP